MYAGYYSSALQTVDIQYVIDDANCQGRKSCGGQERHVYMSPKMSNEGR